MPMVIDTLTSRLYPLMPREFSRSQRMAEQIRRDLAELVREMKDPRMGFVSFTEVRLNKDLGNAQIFCTVLEKDKRQETIDTLNRAAGFLRTELAKRIRARTVPNLKFTNDDSVERGAEMDDLIRKAVDSHGQQEDHSDDNDEQVK